MDCPRCGHPDPGLPKRPKHQTNRASPEGVCAYCRECSQARLRQHITDAVTDERPQRTELVLDDRQQAALNMTLQHAVYALRHPQSSQKQTVIAELNTFIVALGGKAQ